MDGLGPGGAGLDGLKDSCQSHETGCCVSIRRGQLVQGGRSQCWKQDEAGINQHFVFVCFCYRVQGFLHISIREHT